MYDVVISDSGCVMEELVQYRFPMSRRRRIRKKWLKKKENFRMGQVRRIVKMGNTIYMSQQDFDRIEKTLNPSDEDIA